ncbi:MAG: hypothetical protein LBM75_08750 [Myxococcales bacterium]|jgi:DNA primase|nr:hypothetical protein [Myxococcales bacterium]
MTSRRVRFCRARLPGALQFYQERHGIALHGGGSWRNALCPFHADKNPSLRIHIENGAYWCPVCEAKGDILKFHQQVMGMDFHEAVLDLGAYEEEVRRG